MDLLGDYLSYLIIGVMIFIFILVGTRSILFPFISIRNSKGEIVKKLGELQQFEDASTRFLEFDKWLQNQPKSNYQQRCVIPAWKGYYKKFLNLKQNGVIFTPDVYDFFVEDSFVNKYGSRKLVDVIPGVFLALGIIGTFAGIAIGVSGLNPAGDSAVMKAGIGVLLGGMKIKFLSSIIGISFSVLWQVIDKMVFYPMLSKGFVEIRQAMDETFPTQEESTVLFQMFKNQEKQITDFQLFLSDVMIPNMVSGISQTINQSLTPHFEQTHSIMTDLVKNANANQIEGINSMVDHFVSSLSEVTGEHMKGLGEALQTTIEWQQRVHSEMIELVDSMQESAKGQSQMVDKTTLLTEQIHGFTERLTDYQDVFENTITRLNETTDKNSHLQTAISNLLEKMTEERITFNKYFSDHINALKSNIELVISQTEVHTELHNKFESNLEKINDLTVTQQELSDTLAKQSDIQQKSFNNFNEVLEKLSIHGDKFTKLQQGVNEATERNSNLQDNISNLINNMVQERESFHRYFNDHLGHLETNIGTFMSQTEQQVHMQSKLELNLQQILELTSSQQALAESLTNQAKLSVESNNTLSNLLEKIDNHGSLFSSLQSELKKALDKTIMERQKVDEMMDDLYSGLTDQLDQFDSRSVALKEFWDTQKDVLQSLNKQLNQSMNQFTTDMHQGLENTFNQFDEELSKAVQYLSNGVNAIQDGIVDLPDAIQTLNYSVTELNKHAKEMVKTGE